MEMHFFFTARLNTVNQCACYDKCYIQCSSTGYIELVRLCDCVIPIAVPHWSWHQPCISTSKCNWKGKIFTVMMHWWCWRKPQLCQNSTSIQDKTAFYGTITLLFQSIYQFILKCTFYVCPQVVTNRDTLETLLCIAYVFEVSTSEHGAQHHIYRLVKDWHSGGTVGTCQL